MSGQIIFFHNGTTAVLEDGAQQPELQQPWVILFAEFLEAQGLDPTRYALWMPGGWRAHFVKRDGKWSCDFPGWSHEAVRQG